MASRSREAVLGEAFCLNESCRKKFGGRTIWSEHTVPALDLSMRSDRWEKKRIKQKAGELKETSMMFTCFIPNLLREASHVDSHLQICGSRLGRKLQIPEQMKS